MNKRLVGLGLVAAMTGGYLLVRPTSGKYRSRVVEAARSQVGLSDPSPYWTDTLGPAPWPKSWCGAFALWALHKAGLARNLKWVIGVGFLNHLPRTTSPKPGDIAYFHANQHQAVVSSVTGNSVTLINGNGYGGKVTTSTSPISAVAGFYSIEGLINEKVS